jgi:hypothetical protein
MNKKSFFGITILFKKKLGRDVINFGYMYQ